MIAAVGVGITPVAKLAEPGAKSRFAVSVVIVVVASLTSPQQSDEELTGLTYSAVTPEQKAENRASWGTPEVVGTIGVLALVAGIYLYFSFWL